VTEALQTHELPFFDRLALFFCVIATTLFVVMLAGCGYTGTGTPAIALGGSVHGGLQPVSGATVQLYAAGSTGNGSAAQPLLSDPVKTDSNGNFSIPASYTCPSASSQIYVVAQGGNPGLSSGNNSALVLAAMLGSCSGLSGSGSISVNEVTTVGSVWPLAGYMIDSTHLGSASGDASFMTAVTSVPEIVNNAQGSSPGTPTATSYFAQNAKLYSLADVLAGCVNSAGGAAGDGSPCGVLFSTATPSGGSAPTDTLTAALRIAQNPKNNVGGIYGLLGGNNAFKPTLAAAPTDWALNLSFAVATPAISLPTGAYVGAQQVTLSDSTPGSTIYYTTDGTVPTSSSPAYSGPIAIGITSTIQAIAILQGSQSSVASSALTISPTLLQAKLVFLRQPSNAVAQTTIAPAVTVAVEDINGNLVPVADDPVQLTLVGGTGLLSGTLVVTPQNGVATFSNLSVDTAGTGYTLVATSPNLPPAISSSFNISAAGSGTPTTPAKLAFLQQPTNAVAGAAIAPAVTVVVEDSNGNTVTTATNPVTVALTTGTGLAGTLTATPQNGVATFSNLAASNAGTFTLSAASPNLTSATSAGFTISAPGGGTPPPPAKLAFSQQPSNALTGATMSPAVTVIVQDGNGNTVTTATNPVTLALNTGTGLTGTLTATPQNGIATFASLVLSTAGTYTLSAASPNLVAANSTSFIITSPGGGTPPPAAKLAFSQQPSNASTGATISPAVTVVVEDNTGNKVTTATNPVTLALTGTAGLAGTLTVTPQNGVATFSGLSVAAAGTYTLSATSPSLTSATSASFTISAPGGGTPTPAKLAFTQQPSNVATQATITPAVTVTVEDSSGNPVTAATNPVTIALSTGSGLAGTLTVTPQNGVATFSNLSESTAGTYTLSATSPGLTTATSATFTVSSAAASCSITSFGAVGDGVTNNATAIQNTFNYAATNKCTALIPAGTFAYSGTLTAKGIAVTGTGAASILKALDTNNEALTLTGNGGSISNLVMLGTGTTRNVTYQAAMIWVNGATNFTVQNVLINGGSCVGIYNAGGQTGLIQNNTVENTLADSITNTYGASNITVKGNHVLNSGDDGISNNSYLVDPNTVHDITVQGNTIIHNAWGRGLEVSGGSNITFEGNYVDNLDGYTDMYIASEAEYKTQNVANITVTGNTFVDGGPNQGSAIIYNSEAGSTTIIGVTLTGNQFVNPKLNAVQLAGSGSETGLVIENNTDFSTGAFSFSGNPSASATETGNQVLAPSTYTTPLVPPGGGCSFTGC
jgi:hypothetical protein